MELWRFLFPFSPHQLSRSSLSRKSSSIRISRDISTSNFSFEFFFSFFSFNQLLITKTCLFNLNFVNSNVSVRTNCHRFAQRLMNLAKWKIRIFINHIRSIQRQHFPRVSTFVFLSFLRNRCWKGNVATIPHTQSILNPLTISRAIRPNDLIKRMGFCRISTSPSFTSPPLSPAQGVEFRSSRRPSHCSPKS